MSCVRELVLMEVEGDVELQVQPGQEKEVEVKKNERQHTPAIAWFVLCVSLLAISAAGKERRHVEGGRVKGLMCD